MNYLAHLSLSQKNEESILGNLMGDFCKGIKLNCLPVKVVRGIKNHRAVDSFTDSHFIVMELRKLFSKRRRRFAGIIIDMVFDHFLIKYWKMFNEEDLYDFIRQSYNCLLNKRELMPSKMSMVMTVMIKENWLKSYSKLSGIDAALNRISHRINFSNSLANSIKEVEQHYSELDKGFLSFFPDLSAHIHRINIEG